MWWERDSFFYLWKNKWICRILLLHWENWLKLRVQQNPFVSSLLKPELLSLNSIGNISFCPFENEFGTPSLSLPLSLSLSLSFFKVICYLSLRNPSPLIDWTIQRLAAHLVFWNKARIINTLTKTNVYVVNPNPKCSDFYFPFITQKFSRVFPAFRLPEVLER
jgi:hypothetical protein